MDKITASPWINFSVLLHSRDWQFCSNSYEALSWKRRRLVVDLGVSCSVLKQAEDLIGDALPDGTTLYSTFTAHGCRLADMMDLFHPSEVWLWLDDRLYLYAKIDEVTKHG